MGYSVLYPPDADVETLTDVRRLGRLRDVPNLTPLIVAKAMYLPAEHAVVLRVEFGGRRALVFSPLRRATPAETLLDRVSTGFLTSVPRGLTDKELAAVRAGVVESGMSLNAVHYAWGFPDEVRGARLIYKGRGQLTILGGRALFVTRDP